MRPGKRIVQEPGQVIPIDRNGRLPEEPETVGGTFSDAYYGAGILILIYGGSGFLAGLGVGFLIWGVF